ncbi:MAG TPA: U32 family peptidase, partial [Firmicutes bacterium]|nr:U32 family peptidase [Bacillota bacterium]
MNEDRAGRPELLAPVGDWDCLVAAVQNGADAVYLGGQQFSARQFAENFGPEEMSRAVTYAHVRGVRVYVAVNTLIKEREIASVLEYAAGLYSMGVDAVIVQDLGLLSLLARALPALPVHASTQMTVHHPETIRWLAGRGVKRVVLARELSLEEVRDCVAAGLELEVFVHGALCVSYSGQCLMSSMIGGRSGNRGRCAQPCRLEYTLVDREGRPFAGAGEAGSHLLSTRDLAALDLLPDLTA